MKKNRFLARLAVLLLLVLCCTASVGTVQSEAKTYRYCGSLLSKSIAKQAHPIGYFYKAKLGSAKLTLYGECFRYNGTSGFKGKKILSGKKTFKLAKNVKYYYSGGLEYTKTTKKSAKATMKRLNGLYLTVLVKDGKVTKITFSS